MAKRGSLGRNLSALLSQSESVTEPLVKENSLMSLALSALQPGKYQPRHDFSEVALNELAESIKKQGLLQPIVARKVSDERYEIIAGERRWRACQRAGLSSVPVLVRSVDDETAMAMALVENLQREDLNAMDQARAMHRLTDEFDLTHQQVADLLSKSRTAVSNFLRLLQLSLPVRKMLEHGDLNMGHARCLLMLTEAQQKEVAELVIAKSLSVRETERLVTRVKLGKVPPSKLPLDDIKHHYADELKSIGRRLQTKVSLKPGKSGKGSLMLHYENESSLKALMAFLQDN